MPRTKKSVPYECPRCGYQTSQLPSMVRHLQERKKPCPATKSNITLTNEIKEALYIDRVYIDREKEKETKAANSIVNNNHTTNNLIINISNNFKNFMGDVPIAYLLPALLKHSGLNLETVDDMVKRSIKDTGWLGKLDTDKDFRNPTPVLKIQDYQSLLDNMTRASDNNTIPCLFTDNESNTGAFDPDKQKHNAKTETDIVRQVFTAAQDQFFNDYENHLKERATCDAPDNPIVYRAFNILVEYYRVLQAFGLYTPLCHPLQSAWAKAENASAESRQQLRDKFVGIVKENSDSNRDYILSRIKSLIMPDDMQWISTSGEGGTLCSIPLECR